jgi:CubicO group peptidase (beta-lactamase class C family)
MPSMQTAPEFERLQTAFFDQAAAEPEAGAALCVYLHGECVVDLWTAGALAPDAILPVFSSTKGVAGIVIAYLVEQGMLDLDQAVASYWPEFTQAGKSAISVRTLLSHQAGLPGVTGGYDFDEVLEHRGLAARLAAQRPFWRPGAAHGYHPITIGTLADELVARITGRRLGSVLATDLATPLGADVFIGLPEEQRSRVTDLIDAEPSPPPATATGYRSVTAARSGYQGAGEIVNDPRVRAAGQAAMGGVASARGLARLYSACISPVDGARLLSAPTVEDVGQLQTFGPDLVLGDTTAYATMFQKPRPAAPFGSYAAFGHSGVGGSLAYADPLDGIAFGYIPVRMPIPGAADSRALQLVQVLHSCLNER